MNKVLSLVLVCVMLVALLPNFTLPVMAEEDAPLPPNPYDGINYIEPEIIVEGSVDGFIINLSKETFAKPNNYTIAAFSVDGGTKWNAAKEATFTVANFPKLLLYVKRKSTLKSYKVMDCSRYAPLTLPKLIFGLRRVRNSSFKSNPPRSLRLRFSIIFISKPIFPKILFRSTVFNSS